MTETVEVRVRVTGGAGKVPSQTLRVEAGTSFRALLHLLGLPLEGSALWWEGEPVPSDARVPRGGELEVVSTFSGG